MEHKTVMEDSQATIHGAKETCKLQEDITQMSRAAEAKFGAALSFDEGSGSNSDFCENEQGSAASIYELAAYLVIGGLCAIFQNYWL
jgi:hypothetical protein